MSIPVTPESKELYENTGEYENCIFCNVQTPLWNEETNRPICKVCSTLYNMRDLESAKFNY